MPYPYVKSSLLGSSLNSTKDNLLYESHLAFYITRGHLLPEISPLPDSFCVDRISTPNQQGHFVPSIRNHFIFKIAQYILKEHSFAKVLESEVLRKIAVIGELCITIMYLDNHLQDWKYGIQKEDQETIDKNRAERQMLRTQLDSFVETQLLGVVREKVREVIQKLFDFYAIGMKIDREFLTFEVFQRDNPQKLHLYDGAVIDFVAITQEAAALFPSERKMRQRGYQPISKLSYLDLLLTRCHLMNALFFQLFAELLADLLTGNSQQYASLIQWSKRFGIISQLVNDTNDFLPNDHAFATTTKKTEDTWSDGRRKLVTLPMMAFFEHASGPLLNSKLAQHYQEKSIDTFKLGEKDSQHAALQTLAQTRAIRYSMHLIFQLTKDTKKFLDKHNPVSASLNQMLEFANNNKFYVEYLNYFKEFGL